LTPLADLTGWFFLLLAQADKAAAPAPTGGDGGGAGAGGGGLFGDPSFLVMMVVTMGLMYFLLMRPEQRKKKEQQELLSNLKDNDHVVTIGGICGVVVSASKDSNYVTIRVDDKTGTKIRVLRSAISRVGTADEAADEEAKAAK
jgi:preprotein translocase subunit YajC